MALSSKFGIPDIEKQAIEMTYDSLCDVFEYIEEITASGEIINSPLTLLYGDIQCGLSKKNNSVSKNDSNYIDLVDTYVLFIAPELHIKPNFKIVVKKHDRTYDFILNAEPVVYATHQEINMRLDGET